MKKIYRYLTHGALLAAVFVICGSASSSSTAALNERVLVAPEMPQWVKQERRLWCVFACLKMIYPSVNAQCDHASLYATIYGNFYPYTYCDCCRTPSYSECNIGVQTDHIEYFMGRASGSPFYTMTNAREFCQKILAIPDSYLEDYHGILPMYMIYRVVGEIYHCVVVTKLYLDKGEYGFHRCEYLDPGENNEIQDRYLDLTEDIFVHRSYYFH